jgi:hypothetical protein
VLRTVLEQLKDQGNVDVLETKNGIINEIANGVNEASSQFEATHLDCVVIGGGQAGLTMDGWLKALNISYVVFHKISGRQDIVQRDVSKSKRGVRQVRTDFF